MSTILAAAAANRVVPLPVNGSKTLPDSIPYLESRYPTRGAENASLYLYQRYEAIVLFAWKLTSCRVRDRYTMNLLLKYCDSLKSRASIFERALCCSGTIISGFSIRFSEETMMFVLKSNRFVSTVLFFLCIKQDTMFYS